ncbi:MAG TPA: PD-(D/E)XK nuclease family protein [Thermoleophilaceae bacterium]
MPLKLVTGPANAAKAGVVFGDYRAALDREPILVVPAFRDVAHSQRELAERGAVFGTRVVRFRWLFEIVAERCGSESLGARKAAPLQRELIVERAVRDARLEVLVDSARRPGFVRAAERLIRELERSMVTPARFGQALAAWAGDGARRPYADEVAAIYRSYRATLERAGLVDDELYAWHALDALRARAADWGGGAVFVYGFDDFTPIERGLIEALADDPDTQVVVSLPYEEGRAAFEAVEPLVRDLAERASEHEVLPASAEHYAPESREALNRVERLLFAPDGGEADPAGAVRLLSSGGERAEVELVAAEVLRLLRAGTPAGQVAVVFREVAPYASLIEQVLSAYGIPFALERWVPLGHTGLGRGALALLRCAGPEGTADDLLTYLRTAGRLDQPHLADRLEHEVRRLGARTAAAAREIWERDRWQLGEIDRIARARDAATLAQQLDEEVERLFARPYERTAHVFADEEGEDPRAREALRGALSGIQRLARADAGLAPPRERLHDLLTTVEVRTGAAPAPDRVQIARPQDIRARRFDAVFVCGLQEGEFPKPPRPEPFLSDEDRRAIAQATGLALPLREERPARERQLFYVCASRAERCLALSWRETDEEGSPQLRSFLVDDVRALFGERLREPDATRPLSSVTWAAEQAPTEVEWERAAALAGPRRSPPRPERIEAEDVLADLASTTRLSPAALESYADCPVKWLVERRLRPDALEPDPEPMVRGRYAHAVLELTYRRLGERTGSRRVTHKSLAEAERILLGALRERQSEFRLSPQATRVRAAVRRLEVDLLRYLRAEADAGSVFEPAELELDFGLEGSLQPPLVLDDGLEVGGRIDRVDVWDGHAIVRDYKGGSKVEGVAKWGERNRLQVALYMLAVREVLGLRPAGGVYQPLKGRDRRPRGVLLKGLEDELGTGYVGNDFRDEEEIERELDAARERLLELAARMRSGEVRPCPETCAWNGGCSYPSICRIER